ncbi:pilus assembly protein [Mesorhizobium sp. M2D.F.Ca.ET.185.01.1.1]|uniref:TadE/TadG family type IV pilus assembly protein n=1 Tax=unclassified Mesorhizobium TaxID=325217 RepID=UPI000FCBBEDF|nr:MULTISPECIES: TadE/TadG family type IV pilus assembly protein [unclassified Mesorhizobium]TGP51249.1 pilus assembly protein [bacterium M00.F.Ca.ET.230.01.1.1]TGP78022.1 pilus assembly protein [bacterium M00.F.Ca.ET.227.01.1.1]TGP88145.1 pilus assembly protein [bacterium M00.F.Ca.ET.221.01.1.1]TGP93359.1 pilus assembly protein [bacterium M00.F.Ca.ET.222.01.1.1]TGT72618.1 pilus assembly protein [bacterium M00.F.Ca.ET.159.01.1.1]TGT85787.1 pilus assembly protein [bacterium M00.F.Ca.ET.157.01.
MSKDATSGDGTDSKARAKSRPGFFSDRRGSTAMEFAMLAIPFALLVFAILESCISFAGQEVMANVTDDVARQLRTGQLQKSNVTDSSIKQLICSRLQIIVAQNCPGLQVDLREYSSFANAASAGFRISGNQIILTQGGSDTNFTVAPGLAESINMLRVFYKWPVMTDLLAKQMANFTDGTTLHFASVTWQNEPFDDN